MHATLVLDRPRLRLPNPRHALPARRRPHLETFAPPPASGVQELCVNIISCADYTIVYFVGVLEITTYDAAYETLFGLLDSAGPRLILDLGGVTFANARGISPLMQAIGAANSRGGWVRLARVPDPLMRIFDVLRYTELLSIHATVSDAAETAPHHGDEK